MTDPFASLEQADALLLETFPELKAEYDEWLASWGGEIPGAFNTYSVLLVPLLEDAASARRSVPSWASRAAELLGRLADSSDERCVELLATAVLEPLDATAYDVLRPHLAEQVAAISDPIFDQVRRNP